MTDFSHGVPIKVVGVPTPWKLLIGFATVVATASIALSTFLYTKVQDERERTIRTSCVQSNQRYDAAVRVLDAQIAQMPRRQAEAYRDATLAFIDALAPKRDCVEYTRRQVRTATP